MPDLLFTPVGLLGLLALSYAVVSAGRFIAGRRRRRTRIVEKPNSEHTWQRVLEQEMRTRWDALPLERLHPVNREEVLRLLARVRLAGSDVLRPQERRFLDRMVEVAGSAAPPRPGAAPDLRHRTT